MKILTKLIFLLFVHPLFAIDNIEESSSFTLNNLNPLFKHGISIEAEYIGELWFLDNREKIDVYNPNIINGSVIFDFNNLFGIPDSELELNTISVFGKDPNEDFGSQQGITNIGAYNTSKIFQFFYEQSIFNKRLQFIIGLIDVNSEFDVKFSSKKFLNPSHGIGYDWSQTGANGPSIYPTTSIGARVRFLHKGNIVMQFAVLDGIPGDTSNPNGTRIILNDTDGLLVAGTIYHLHGESLLELPDNNYAETFEHTGMGFWYYTDKYSHIVSDIVNWGLYFVFEQDVFLEENSSQGLSIFGRFGISDDKFNEVDYFIALGGVYKGLISGRDNDFVGLAFANAHNTFEFRTINNFDDRELNVEFFYRFNISDFLDIQVDIQNFLLADKSMLKSNELLLGMRMILSF